LIPEHHLTSRFSREERLFIPIGKDVRPRQFLIHSCLREVSRHMNSGRHASLGNPEISSFCRERGSPRHSGSS
jgi:hypothetical protein